MTFRRIGFDAVREGLEVDHLRHDSLCSVGLGRANIEQASEEAGLQGRQVVWCAGCSGEHTSRSTAQAEDGLVRHTAAGGISLLRGLQETDSASVPLHPQVRADLEQGNDTVGQGGKNKVGASCLLRCQVLDTTKGDPRAPLVNPVLSNSNSKHSMICVAVD